MNKNNNTPKVAVYWSASCGGCDMALLGLHERLLELVRYADIAFWPAATDFKYEDLREIPDGGIEITLFNGAVRTSENEELASLLRQKSEILVAFGSCAHQGGIPGLANLSLKEQVYESAYLENDSTPNPRGIIPRETVDSNGNKLSLPSFFDRVRKLEDFVPVDYSVPGCPPPPPMTERFLDLLLDDDMPDLGAVIAEDKTVCDQCDRDWEKEMIEKFARVHEVEVEQGKCLLDQGIICMGPATRSGCEARCPQVNMPCMGCLGPPPNVRDQGTEMLNSLASIFRVGEEGENLEQEKVFLENLPDPLGTFYQFSLPSSIFGGRVTERTPKER